MLVYQRVHPESPENIILDENSRVTCPLYFKLSEGFPIQKKTAGIVTFSFGASSNYIYNINNYNYI